VSTRRWLPLVLAVIVWAAPAAAGPGTHAGTFLKLLGGTRHAALGGAQAALPDGAESMFGNPATLMQLDRPAASFLQNFSIADMRLHQAALTMPLNSRTAAGIGIGYMDYGAIPGRDASGYDIGNRSAGDLDLVLAGAWRPHDVVAIGLAGKYLRSSLDGIHAQTGAVDIGLTVRSANRRWCGGVMLQHWGGDLQYDHEANSLPMTWRAGAAWSAERWPLLAALEAVKTSTEDLYWCGGVELALLDRLALRAGYRTRSDAGRGVTAGLAAGVDDWTLEYAWQPQGELGATHRLALGMRWGAPGDTQP